MSGRNQTGSSAAVDIFGRTDLHYACVDSNSVATEKLLSDGCDVNAQDRNGWSPLHFSAQSGCLECLQLLLGAGADTELRDSFGNTPLFRAVFESKGDGSLIKALRAAGADPLAKNENGVSPLSLARTIGNYDVAQFFSDLVDVK